MPGSDERLTVTSGAPQVNLQADSFALRLEEHMENFVEVIVQKKMGAAEMAARSVMIALCLIVPSLVVFIGIYALIVEFFIIYGTYLVFKLTNVEYEYSYAGGNLVLTKIMGQTKRKKLKELDMAKVERLAPENSSEVSYYAGNPSLQIQDYSSGFNTDKPFYLLVLSGEEGLEVLRLELDERLLARMKKDYPMKVTV